MVNTPNKPALAAITTVPAYVYVVAATSKLRFHERWAAKNTRPEPLVAIEVVKVACHQISLERSD